MSDWNDLLVQVILCFDCAWPVRNCTGFQSRGAHCSLMILVCLMLNFW